MTTENSSNDLHDTESFAENTTQQEPLLRYAVVTVRGRQEQRGKENPAEGTIIFTFQYKTTSIVVQTAGDLLQDFKSVKKHLESNGWSEIVYCSREELPSTITLEQLPELGFVSQ